MKFGRNVLQGNTHRLTESNFRFDPQFQRRRRHFTQQCMPPAGEWTRSVCGRLFSSVRQFLMYITFVFVLQCYGARTRRRDGWHILSMSKEDGASVWNLIVGCCRWVDTGLDWWSRSSSSSSSWSRVYVGAPWLRLTHGASVQPWLLACWSPANDGPQQAARCHTLSLRVHQVLPVRILFLTDIFAISVL